MAEINHRYLKDNEGEIYYPVTHIDALQGDISIADINEKIKEMNALIDTINTKVSDMVGDTGWVDISIPPDNKNTAVATGFKSGIREVRAGNSLIGKSFVVRSIRLNVGNITGSSMQIAQLPTGFVTDNQSFPARQHGSRSPVTVECLKDGKVMAYIHPDDQSKTNWLYQEFTWLE